MDPNYDPSAQAEWGLYWIRNELGGQFSQQVEFRGTTGGPYPLRGLAVADLDGDNRPEIVAAVDTEWEGGPENLDKVFIWYNSQAGDTQPISRSI